jgi:hypothetical protein
LFAIRYFIISFCVALGLAPIGAAEHEVSFAASIGQLDSDSFHTRRAAAKRLIDASIQPSEHAQAALNTLQQGLSHRSLEVRLACREVLDTIEQIEVDRQIERLLNPKVDATAIQLSGWKRCSQILGTDMAGRRTFASLVQNHPEQVQVLDGETTIMRVQQTLAKIDPYRISPSNSNQWILLLLLETVYAEVHPKNLISRSCASLSSSQIGPRPQNPRDAIVMRRLVDRWVGAHQNRCPTRECLLIAMRFGCRDRVEEICKTVLRNEMAPPATQVMAMLCASAIQLSDREELIESRLSDHRTAHVWQLIAARKTKIRTQVRDVALALLLHQRGIDPRTVGYTELQADPLLVYRDHSLGFPDEAARHQAHRNGLARFDSSEK